MQADILELQQVQLGVLLHGAENRRMGRQEAAGEDVALDEVHLAAGGHEALIANRDGLQCDQACRFEQALEGLQVGRQILMADRLDHLHRDDAIEAAFQCPVVFLEQRDAILQPFRGDARLGIGVLLIGDGRGGHAAAACSCGMDRQPAPAGADFQQVMLRPEFQQVEQLLQLVGGGRLQTGLGIGKHRRGIHAVLAIEEQLEEIIAEIVMRRDVALRTRQRIARQRVGDAQRPLGQARRPAVHRVIDLFEVVGEQAHQPDQIIRLPLAIHVGLRRRDGATQRHAPPGA